MINYPVEPFLLKVPIRNKKACLKRQALRFTVRWLRHYAIPFDDLELLEKLLLIIDLGCNFDR